MLRWRAEGAANGAVLQFDAMKKASVAQVKPLLEEHDGNISAVARALSVARDTIYARIDESAVLQQTLRNARERMLDEAESVLYRKVKEGSTPELLFFLKTQGRSRGYIERQELEHQGSISVNAAALIAAMREGAADAADN